MRHVDAAIVSDRLMRSDLTPERRCEDVVVREIDGELAIYDLSRQSVHFLNATAALIWRLCDGSHSVSMIQDEMTRLHPDAAARIDADVEATVQAFASVGLLADPRA